MSMHKFGSTLLWFCLCYDLFHEQDIRRGGMISKLLIDVVMFNC